MYRKQENKIQTQPVIMALMLNQDTKQERIIVGSELEVRAYLEGKTGGTQPLVLDRPLGQLIFDWDEECAAEWNDKVIYEMKSALSSRLNRKKGEQKAMAFLKEKQKSGNAISIFWAQNCLYLYEYCKKKTPDQQFTDLFESRMMALTRLCKTNILPKGKSYAVLDAIEDVYEIMRACGYRPDAHLQTIHPWRGCRTEFVIVDESVLAAILYYLKHLSEWRICFRVCDICGKYFTATSAHYSLCSDACRKEKNRINKQEFDKRAQQNMYDRDYASSTRRMRDMMKRNRRTGSAEGYASAKLFYEQFREEAKKRKKKLKTQQEKNIFRDWLFEQEWQLEEVLGGTK